MKTFITPGIRVSTLETLRNSRLFSGACEAELEQIAAISMAKTVAHNDYLFYEGTSLSGFYVVQSGAIKVRRVSSSGAEQVLHIFRPCESFGEEMLFLDSGYPADACAAQDSSVVMVWKNEFIALLKRNPDLALRILRSMDVHMRHLVGVLDNLMWKDVKTRLASWLIQHCPDPQSKTPYTIQLSSTKKEIASELGTISETFSRNLAKLRRQQLLTIDGNRITLLCPFKLAQFVESRA